MKLRTYKEYELWNRTWAARASRQVYNASAASFAADEAVRRARAKQRKPKAARRKP